MEVVDIPLEDSEVDIHQEDTEEVDTLQGDTEADQATL